MINLRKKRSLHLDIFSMEFSFHVGCLASILKKLKKTDPCILIFFQWNFPSI